MHYTWVEIIYFARKGLITAARAPAHAPKWAGLARRRLAAVKLHAPLGWTNGRIGTPVLTALIDLQSERVMEEVIWGCPHTEAAAGIVSAQDRGESVKSSTPITCKHALVHGILYMYCLSRDVLL